MTVKRGLILLACVVIAILLVAAGFALSKVLQPKDNPVPASISSQIDFTPLVVPANNTTLRSSNYKVGKIEEDIVLSYIISIDHATVTVTEYQQPSQFTDVPDFKDKFLENVIQQTTSVSTASGTIILGQQAKQQNKQLGIMLERGLVVLMNPDKALEQKQWRTIGDALSVIKPSN